MRTWWNSIRTTARLKQRASMSQTDDRTSMLGGNVRNHPDSPYFFRIFIYFIH